MFSSIAIKPFLAFLLIISSLFFTGCGENQLKEGKIFFKSQDPDATFPLIALRQSKWDKAEAYMIRVFQYSPKIGMFGYGGAAFKTDLSLGAESAISLETAIIGSIRGELEKVDRDKLFLENQSIKVTELTPLNEGVNQLIRQYQAIQISEAEFVSILNQKMQENQELRSNGTSHQFLQNEQEACQALFERPCDQVIHP